MVLNKVNTRWHPTTGKASRGFSVSVSTTSSPSLLSLSQRKSIFAKARCLLLLVSSTFLLHVTDADVSSGIVKAPKLNGRHLDITIVADNIGFVNLESKEDGTPLYTGFLIDVLEAIAMPDRANFTYTLKPPSGLGSLCPFQTEEEPYPEKFRFHYGCGQSDVTDHPFHLNSNFTTDMYVGAFYVTAERQMLNHFTVPLYPPTSGTQAMVGTATYVADFEDLVQQQKLGKQKPACVFANTAYSKFVQDTFPDMELQEINPGIFQPYLDDGTCDVVIAGHHFAASLVKTMFKQGTCLADGKPIGIIGDPLGFGLNYLAFGIRKDLPMELVDTLNFWLLYLMSCTPTEECPHDSLAVMYPKYAGTGRECGYVQYPPLAEAGISGKIVAGIVVGVILLVGGMSSMIYLYKLRQQEKRFKKRFVQQIARNINIGPSPSCIPVEKLAEEVQHIGNESGTITKSELLRWMCDVKLEFISDKDFDALWAAMDLENKGEVNAIDFFVFLSACGSEFEQVYKEQEAMPKTERIKWAARRLSNINKLGENGVRALQLQLERKISGNY